MPGFPGGLARMGQGNKQDDVTKPTIARVDPSLGLDSSAVTGCVFHRYFP